MAGIDRALDCKRQIENCYFVVVPVVAAAAAADIAGTDRNFAAAGLGGTADIDCIPAAGHSHCTAVGNH